MTLLQAIGLGILQGITEFFPVSSSGHLVLAESLIHLQIASHDMQTLNVLLHAGTLLALLIAYAPVWLQLLRDPRQLPPLIVATIPGALTGLFLEEWIAMRFQSLLYVGIAFACTGIILLVGERCPHKQHRNITMRSALIIGITQAIALIPGISRSGITISAGRWMGLNRKDALDFSFLMAMPIIAGASLMSLRGIIDGTVTLPPLPVLTLAIATSFVCSLLSIMFLRSFVVRRSLGWFAPYLFALSALTILHKFFS